MPIDINVLAGHAPATRPAPVTPICQLSVIVPIFNEEAVIAQFHARLIQVLASCPGVHEIIYVDDGSTDSSRQVLEGLRQACPQVGVARLSRNFGKERAMTAGLEMARGEAVIILDVDLQDPPELIPRMLDAWRTGADVVNMRRTGRDGETMIKKATAHFFYRIINRLSDVSIPSDVGDFRLFSRRAVDALNRLPESNRFMKGLFAWIGFSQVTLEYHRQARAAGDSKWPYWKLWNFALEGVTSFSTVPLRIASYIGFASAFGAFVYALYFLVKTYIWGDPVKGFPTLIEFVLLLGGLQLMAIGIMGEYVGRMYLESKRRPVYLLDAYQPALLAADPSA
ncbi:glycosyltransferase family 2 protein [Rhodoferax sp.]|uniref:glycosyltransferase family 2 protein n=1 Tax=Rhodoferax sp. TaxID=50421 RepID=UPI001EB4A359|nr:glycosyltransferase family 2 protein [Rhodoferax sp.]MBT9506403.1 glycosyltransferase family 2 protein [Rhodoferax sp.]